MTREQAKLAFLSSTSVPFPSGECFDAGYDVSVNNAMAFLEKSAKRLDDNSNDQMVVLCLIVAFRLEFSQK